MSEDAFGTLLEEVFGDKGRVMRPELERVGLGEPRPNPPQSHETAAITIRAPKTAAMCYDRVWSPAGRYPEGLGFFCGSPSEIGVTTLSFLISTMGDMVDRGDSFIAPQQKRAIAAFARIIEGIELPSEEVIDLVAHRLSVDLARLGVRATPIFCAVDARQRIYAPGDQAVIVSTLAEVPVIREDELSWQQVLDFRKDGSARRDLRRLTHWLDVEMVGKSHAFVHDEIAIRLERYREALNKHGVVTVLGTLSSTLDSRALVGGAAAVSALSYAADSTWGLVAGGSIVVGKAAVHLAQGLLERSSIANERFGEIAFVIHAGDMRGSVARPN